MSETRFARVLSEARELGRAVGAFTCYNFEQLHAVVSAAEDRRAPAIVLISPASFRDSGGKRLVRGFKGVTEDASVDVLLQLDHVPDQKLIEWAAACGVDAIMADGSKLPYDENLSFTRSVVSSMRGLGVGVEAELGRIEGQEDEAIEATAGAMTDPAEEKRFRDESGVDCLAVSVGNVHGHYSGTPELDWSRLDEIRNRDILPLSLHGASGLPDEDLRRATSLGVAKLNVNTELRAAYFGRLKEELDPSSQTLNLKHLGDRLKEAVYDVVEKKLTAFGWPEDGET
ncbi:MAG: class II fructose-bisphosphate aldolase [Rubrobacteraceae bacterium]